MLSARRTLGLVAYFAAQQKSPRLPPGAKGNAGCWGVAIDHRRSCGWYLVEQLLDILDCLERRADGMHVEVLLRADVVVRLVVVLDRSVVVVHKRFADEDVSGAELANLQTDVVSIVQGAGKGIVPRAGVRQFVAVQAQQHVAGCHWLGQCSACPTLAEQCLIQLASVLRSSASWYLLDPTGLRFVGPRDLSTAAGSEHSINDDPQQALAEPEAPGGGNKSTLLARARRHSFSSKQNSPAIRPVSFA